MLVQTSTAFALRCPRCGKMEMSSISLFQLGGGRPVKVSCSCGEHAVTIRQHQGKIALQFPCYLCDGMHFLYYSPQQFWGAALEQVSCAETDLQLGVFGGFDEVETYVRPGETELDRLLEDAAFDDYFDHREVMHRTLGHVHELAEDGLVTCVCGSRRIAVDIYPDRLELTCEECGRQRPLPAGNEDDLSALERLGRIDVGDDAPSRRKGHKHKK